MYQIKKIYIYKVDKHKSKITNTDIVKATFTKFRELITTIRTEKQVNIL